MIRKIFIPIAIILLVNIIVLLSRPSYEQESSTKTNTIAYTIKVPGEKTDGGWTPAKFINIPRVSSEHYLPNVFYLKTKTAPTFDKKANYVLSSNLMSMLSNLHVRSMRSPFAFSGGDSPLRPEPYGLERIIEVYYNNDIDPYDVCAEFINSPDVEYAVPVFIHQTYDYTPNDPRLNNQWYINNIQLRKAWDISKGSEDVIIAIVDSGTDWMHEDLADNIWINKAEIADNGIDDDGNGKVDDIRGWDLVGNINQNQIIAGQWQENNNPRNPGTSSNNTHGTHVAGCASAVTDNGKGIAGPGFKTKLMPVKCATDQNIRGIYRGYEGITYAANTGAHIINCSWGGPGYSPVGQDVINAAVAKGSLVVVAAGNSYTNIDNGEQYPAAYDNVVCVGATSSNNRKANFSCWGIVTTVYAPGQGILATMPNNTYQNSDGTSMASPITAGVAGLIKAINKDWTPKQILHQLRSTSDNVVTTDPNLRPYYYGRLNAYNAVRYNREGGPGIPGIEVTKLVMPSGDMLTNYDPVVVRMEVTNFLAASGNVTAKIQPLNNFISISTPSVQMGSIGKGQTKNIDLALQLLNNNPWYEGYASILVTFESSNYTNYQLVKIPVSIKSNNRYSLVTTIPEVYIPEWMGAVSPNSSLIWMVGYGGMFGNNGGFYKLNGPSASGNAISTEYAFCVDALDATTAWIGTGTVSNTSATVRKTVNGGANWTPTVITPITTFINSIHFYDAQNGVFLGDPKSNKWGIGLSTDGGGTWTQPASMPAPLAEESGLVGCAAYSGTNIWFGTNKGRVIMSKNSGNSWNATEITGAGQIWNVAMMDDKNGLAVYSDIDETDKIIATTSNSGLTWNKNQYNLTLNRLNPIYFYTNLDAGRIYMLCSGGQVYSTKSNGRTWDAVLSKYHGNSRIGAAALVPTSKMRIWDIEEQIGYLDFSYIPANVINKIELQTSATENYDTVSVGTFRLKTASVKNTGNVPILVTPEIVPDAGTEPDEFRLYAFSNGDMEPESELGIRVRFTPASVGFKSATLNIRSNAEPGNIKVTLLGYGGEPVSVEQSDELPDDISVSPNPAGDYLFLSGNDMSFDRIDIINISGEIVKSIDLKGKLDVIDIRDIPAGTYYIILNKSNKTYYKKISVIR